MTQYRMQAHIPSEAPHDIETWKRMYFHAGHDPQELDDLVMWAGGHAKDGGNGRPFVLFCIRNGWITEA